MAAAKLITIKVTEDRRAALHALASAFGESLSTFLLRGALERAQRANAGPVDDPFVLQLRRAASKRGADLTAKERALVNQTRRDAKAGAKALSVAEARRAIKGW